MLDEDSNTQIIYVKPAVFISGLIVLVFIAFGLFFHEAVEAMFINHTQPAASDIRGKWVGEVAVHAIRDPWVRKSNLRAAICFKLELVPSFLRRYRGWGEITIQGMSAQKIELTNLMLSSSSFPQAFELGIWKAPYLKDDESDFLSGGFEGSFKPGVLHIERQRAVGYDIVGDLHTGEVADYEAIVQRLKTLPVPPEHPKPVHRSKFDLPFKSEEPDSANQR